MSDDTTTPKRISVKRKEPCWPEDPLVAKGEWFAKNEAELQALRDRVKVLEEALSHILIVHYAEVARDIAFKALKPMDK